MTEVADKLIRETLQLDPAERATVIEELLSSLDKPDAELDGKWAKEAEARLSAVRAGEIEAIPANDVFSELGRDPIFASWPPREQNFGTQFYITKANVRDLEQAFETKSMRP